MFSIARDDKLLGLYKQCFKVWNVGEVVLYTSEIYRIEHAYFIPSSEFNAYLKQIKVILSIEKKVLYFFTSDISALYFLL